MFIKNIFELFLHKVRKIGILKTIKRVIMENVYKIFIIDDSAEDLNIMKERIISFFDVKKMEYQIIQSLQGDDETSYDEYDIAFIDICMPISGFEIARKIVKHSPNTKIVFCTNHNELVFDAFQIDLFGFVRKDHLDVDLENILNKFEEKTKYYKYKINKTIPLRKILYFEATHNYVLIHLINDIQKERTSLKKLDIEKYEGFCKISSSFIVNMEYIIQYDKDRITMRNGDVVYLSRACKKEFRDAYARYLIEL